VDVVDASVMLSAPTAPLARHRIAAMKNFAWLIETISVLPRMKAVARQ
jgi:hypothetical protein